MKQASKWLFCSIAVSALAACGSSSIDDSFFQADAVSPSAGNVCIDGAKIAQNGQEAKDTVAHLKKFYGGYWLRRYLHGLQRQSYGEHHYYQIVLRKHHHSSHATVI